MRNVDPVEDPDKDTARPADYHEVILIYNELAPVIKRRYQQNLLVDWEIPVPVTIRLTEEPGNTKTVLETIRTELERVFGVQVSGFDAGQHWDGPRNMTLAGKGFYEARYLLYLPQYGVAASAGWSGTGATGGSLWAAPVVLYSASTLFSAERVLSLTGTDTLGATLTTFALAAAADSTYDIGTNAVRYKKVYSDDLDSTAATIGTLTLSNPLADASVANDITCSNYVATADHTKAAHDALAMSHDSLSDVSADDHHTEAHALSSHSDVSLTGAYMEDLAMYLEANAAYVPFNLVPNATYTVTTGGDARLFNFVGTGAQIAWFDCPLPIDKGGLSLHIKGWRITLADADASSYVDTVVTFKADHTGATTIDTDTDNLDSAAQHTETFAVHDCTGQTRLSIRCSCTVGTAADLDFVSVEGLVFYDT